MSKKTAIQRYFDHWSGNYEDDLKAYNYNVPDVIQEHVLPYMKLDARPDMYQALEVGIGTGLSAEILRNTGNAFITGMDISENMLELCRSKNCADELIQHDCNKTPWPVEDARYDIVFAIGIFEYISRPKAFIDEIARTLKKGGFAALSFEPMDTIQNYKSGIFTGVLKHSDDKITLRRQVPRKIFPQYFEKHLYGYHLIHTMCGDSGLELAAYLQNFDGYQWSETQKIKQDFMVLYKE